VCVWRNPDRGAQPLREMRAALWQTAFGKDGQAFRKIHKIRSRVRVEIAADRIVHQGRRPGRHDTFKVLCINRFYLHCSPEDVWLGLFAQHGDDAARPCSTKSNLTSMMMYII
jgi:hypothetical protein